MANANFGTDGLLATTIEHYVNTLEDQVFTSKPFTWALKAAGRFSNANGVKIVQQLLYAESPNKGSYSGTDTFAAPSNTGITAAEFDWKQYYGTIQFNGLELAQNSGKEALLPLLQTRLTQLEMSMAEDINRLFWADGSGNSAKDFSGLQEIVAATGTYGNIDRAAQAWWRAHLDATAGATSLALMRNVYNTVSEGNDQPSNIFTTQDGFEAYEALLADNVRYEDTQMGDAGFQNLMFKGAPVTFDRAAPAGHMYFLNLKYLTFYTLDGKWFDVSDWLRPVNQDTMYKNILCYGNLVASNLKRQGALTGLTDA